MYTGFSQRQFCPHSIHLSVNFSAFALGVKHCLLRQRILTPISYKLPSTSTEPLTEKPRPREFGSLVSLDTHKSLTRACPSLLQNWRWKARMKNCEICSTLKTLQAAEVCNQTVSFLWEGKRANRQVLYLYFMTAYQRAGNDQFCLIQRKTYETLQHL